MSDIIVSSVTVRGVTITRRHGGVLELQLPGFSYSDFNRHGHLSVWTVTRCCEMPVLLRLAPRSSTAEMYQSYNFITSALRFCFSQSLYTSVGISTATVFLQKPGFMSTHSVSTESTLRDQSTGRLLMSADLIFVCIDRKTMRPTKVPTSMDYYNCYDASATRFKINSSEAPASAFVYTIVVSHSDLDFNEHANTYSYIRWMIDAAEATQGVKKLTGFEASQKLCAKELQLRLFQQCFAGDEIKVFVWVEKSDTLCFELIQLKNQRTVCYGRICFYDNSIFSKL